MSHGSGVRRFVGVQRIAAPDSPNHNRRHRELSISSGRSWMGRRACCPAEAGRLSKASRSEVVRLALLRLRDALAGRSRSDTVRFFVQREADRLVATLEGTDAW